MEDLEWLSVSVFLVVFRRRIFRRTPVFTARMLCLVCRCVAAFGCDLACFFPIRAWRKPDGSVTFRSAEGYIDLPAILLGCGQCIGCRLKRSRSWALRIMHESIFHDRSIFVTFTYGDDYLPDYGFLSLRDFQLFMKRLRFSNGPVRFFHCGEYGETTMRPHYHAILFGYYPHDSVVYNEVNGFTYYTSQSLTDLWGKGHVIFGDLTFESAAYVSRYVMKKVLGKAADDHYTFITSDGEVLRRPSEYVTMSRRPGIGSGFMDKYSDDIFPQDRAVHEGRFVEVPRFYLDRLSISNPEMYDLIKSRRERLARDFASLSNEDLAKMAEFKRAQLGLLRRDKI